MFLVSMMNTRIRLTPLVDHFVCLSGAVIDSERTACSVGTVEYRSERSEGGYAAKARNGTPGTSYDRPGGKTHKPAEAAPPPAAPQIGTRQEVTGMIECPRATLRPVT
jgi:hypothetical protein